MRHDRFNDAGVMELARGFGAMLDGEAMARPQADAATWPTRPASAPAPRDAGPPVQRFAYSGTTKARGPAALASAIVVGGLLAAMLHMNIGAPARQRARRLIVVGIPDLAPPPPRTRPQPEHAAPAEPRIVTPPPIVATPALPVAVATTPLPPPPTIAPAPPAARAAPPAPPAPPAVAEGGDLSSRMIFAKPPSYPIESRRRREEGTVVLDVLVSIEGVVADISIAQTSGSTRLDEAALTAVRKWRWAPLLRGDQPAMVRGVVRIPFVIRR